MTGFSVTDAAFAGFRLLQERPKVILAWAGFLFLANILSAGLAMLTGAGRGIAALQALETAGNTDPAAVLAALSDMGGFFVLMLGLSLAFYAVLMAAAYRAYLRPDDGSAGAFRFGGDELRMAGWLVMIFLVWMVYLFLVAFAFALVATFGRALGKPLSAVLDLIALAALLAALVYPAVRLSLAGPMTLDRGQVVFFRSWTLTQGQFWRLFVAYLLTTAVLGLVFLLSMIIIVAILAVVAVAMGGGIGSVAQMAQPDMTSLRGYFSVGSLIYLALNALLSAAALAIFTGPSAEAYRSLSAPARAPSVFE